MIDQRDTGHHRFVPFGQGRARGMDARALGTHGRQVDELISLGLPTVAGVTVPVAEVASLTEPDTAGAVVELLQQLSGRTAGHGERPMLIRLTASAPVAVAGLPPDLPVIGLTPRNSAAVLDAVGDGSVLHEVWAGMLRMIGEHALGVPSARLGDLLLDLADPREQVPALLTALAHEGTEPFPDDTARQLALAARTMLARWETPRAARARRAQKLPPDLPLALHVQALVLGPWQDSGYGTATSRDAETGRFRPTGSFFRGVRRSAPRPPHAEDLSALPGGPGLLEHALLTLEQHFAGPASVEFELRDGELALLSARVEASTSARVTTCLAVDLVRSGARDEPAAVEQVRPSDVVELMHAQLSLTGEERELVRGLPASPGAACGEVVFTSDVAVQRAAEGHRVVLVAAETTPADVPGLLAAAGVVTTNGGLASHAAVVARGAGVPAVCGASALRINRTGDTTTATAGEHVLREGDLVSLDGRTGAVYAGELAITAARPPEQLNIVLGWADTLRRLGVRANADTGRDARTAVELGAEGIGLCRTEHQFLGERLPLIRRVILATDPETEGRALAALARAQREDFRDLLLGIGSRPVTVRLLDAPMHEFLPAPDQAEDEAAAVRAAALREANPMLGVRGVRLALLHERLYPAQAEALFSAWLDVRDQGVTPELEVMIPLVSLPAELETAARQVRASADAVAERSGVDIPYRLGAMVETPRAAVMAGELSRTAEFLSFGTNDLTQLTYGFCRDDVERRILARYQATGLLSASPFVELDTAGVGGLIEIAVRQARAVRPGIKLGICGEHGGNPASIAFCDRLGLDYVSCSPAGVPVARLAAAHAVSAT
ncbi:putative PEP-binding protein [Actinophytocola sp.]|uniref:putative PEP-binding protein n=1 Tax=Actinophytocola sp. TaxID=1872138 RepID=UPI002ED42366